MCQFVLKNIFSEYYELDNSSLPYLTDLFEYHMCQARINSYAVKENTLFKHQDKLTKKTAPTLLSEILGTAIYLTASLFNHSCNPNVIVRFVNQFLMSLRNLSIYENANIIHV